MNDELKSKFRDRLKYFKRLFFLKKKKGSNFGLENSKEKNNEKDIDNNKLNYINKEQIVDINKDNIYKPIARKIYVRKKRIIGIDNSSENLKLKNNINNKVVVNREFDINLNKKNVINKVISNDGFKNSIITDEKKIVSIRYVKKKRKNVGIDDVYNIDIIDNPRLGDNIKLDNKHSNKYNTTFDKKKHIEKNDRELLLNTILGKLDNKSKKMLFKLDGLYSDYYNILNYTDEEINKKECEKRIKEIEKIKKEIEEICKQFNIINDDKYLDNVLDLDDSNLIDDIIMYKNLCNKLIDKKDVYENYKKIENYDRVNTYLDKFTKKIDELKDKKEKKKEEIEKRDKDFDMFKQFVSSVDVKNERYFSIINSQVDICNNILKNVEKIFRRETVDYRLRGLGDLVGSSFRYLFYLSMSPFRGMFPSIAINTLATRHMIRNIRDNLELEEIRKVSYYAKDYENELNRNIYDINNLNNLLYSTLDDINNLKTEFKDKYGKYIDKIPEYKDIYKKIEKIEIMVKYNLDRVKKIENSLNKSKEKNKNKLIKIKELNNKNN